MKLVIQRVSEASVKAEGGITGKINKGYVVFLGIGQEDTQAIALKYADKMMKLRIFADENEKTNLSLQDVGGELLIVSQFTLYADCKKGNRPNFLMAGAPDQALCLYEFFVKVCRDRGIKVETGKFGAHMDVSLVNDGPFTIVLEDLV